MHFMQKFKMAAINGGQTIFGKKWQMTVDNLVEIALSRTICKTNAVFAFTQNFKMVTPNRGKMIFGKKLPDDSVYTLGIKNFTEIALSCTVSEINVFFVLHAEIQKWQENRFGKNWQMTQ